MPIRTRIEVSPRHLSVVGLVMAVVLAVAMATAGYYGVSWALAAGDDSLSTASERDAALQAGTQGITNLNTLDYRDVDRGLDRWESSSTGPLHDEVVRSRKDAAARLQDKKTSTTARILDAGITELDTDAGKAHLIAMVQVTVTKQDQQPVLKRARYQADLSRQGRDWKLAKIEPVSVG